MWHFNQISNVFYEYFLQNIFLLWEEEGRKEEWMKVKKKWKWDGISHKGREKMKEEDKERCTRKGEKEEKDKNASQTKR